ncbi:tRNA(Ile)-lysidine synthetase [Bifidobacterium anseris]|uniref:tRNA(Ile)-lysidine synthase n=1 Tax=Bifidobacterium anseris TaxID=2020963 RepID=A0A2N5IYM3_9BIFI|nr:tRNA lysidine(34) synthetase TilS [Bifidobacterium anseris]PLS27068.1 tRNA(Ile)-lysidine synthetase [Bifidobacterium anseris]
MVYSAAMKQAIGAVRAVLAAQGVTMQDARFARHGEHKPDADAPLILVACSGGRDSLALAAVAATVCAAWGVRAGAVIVDHHMQTGSADVAALAAEQCTALGLDPVVVRDVHVSDEHGDGAEAAARDARYAALVDEARTLGAVVVLLAHTKDDQAETVLIDLIRSAGLDAIAGMPATQSIDGVCFARPLLGVARADTTRICEDLALKWWDDPTNGDGVPADEPLPQCFPLRSRVRHTLLPRLSAFAGRDMTTMLADGATLARRDVELLERLTDDVFARTVRIEDDEEGGRRAFIDARALAGQDAALRFRVVARALAICAPGSGRRHVDAVEALVSHWHGQQAVRLPRKRTANRQKHVIEVCQDVTHANRRHRA